MSEAKSKTPNQKRSVVNIPRWLHTELRVLAAERRKGESVGGLLVAAARKVYKLSDGAAN